MITALFYGELLLEIALAIWRLWQRRTMTGLTTQTPSSASSPGHELSMVVERVDERGNSNDRYVAANTTPLPNVTVSFLESTGNPKESMLLAVPWPPKRPGDTTARDDGSAVLSRRLRATNPLSL